MIVEERKRSSSNCFPKRPSSPPFPSLPSPFGMPPEKRAASPLDVRSFVKHCKIEHDFSPLFDNEDGKANLIIRTSDRISFAVPRAALQLHSSVFEDMLSIPQPRASSYPSSSSSSSSKEALPVVDVSEKSVSFEIFLRYVVPSAFLVDGLPPKFPLVWDTESINLLETVLETASKYDCPMVGNLIARHNIPLLSKEYPLHGWAVAVGSGQLEFAKDAIRLFSYSGIKCASARRWVVATKTFQYGQRDYCLSDLSLDFVERLPAPVIRNFAEVHAKVASCRDVSYDWSKAADEFTLW